jgi:choline dehydrogenase
VPDADLTPIDRGFAAAAATLGFARVDDFNGDPVQTPGIGPMPRNVAGGVRMNAAFSYLAPARSRPNLRLVPDAMVDRVCVTNGRADGVRLADGREFRAKEVILCAGAFGSPAILLRTGIGPATHLREHGIEVIADRPGVGSCLLDHPMLNSYTDFVVKPESTPATTSFCPNLLKARSRQVSEEIDLHFYHGQSFNEERGDWTFWQSISLESARSRGRVRLTAADPRATLEIDHRHLSEPDDLEALCDGVELLARLVSTPPLATMIEPLTSYFPAWKNRDELRAAVREQVVTTFHPSSTCRMGPTSDPDAVVDHAGCVHDIAGLRVVDASIFPTGPRANLHCTVVAVAEKLADAIRAGDPP